MLQVFSDPTINGAKFLGPLLGWSVIWIDAIDGCFRCQLIALRTRNYDAVAWTQQPGKQLFMGVNDQEKKWLQADRDCKGGGRAGDASTRATTVRQPSTQHGQHHDFDSRPQPQMDWPMMTANQQTSSGSGPICAVCTVQYSTVQHPYPEPLPRTSEPTFPIRVGRQIAGRLICSWGALPHNPEDYLANQPAHLSEICPYHARQSQKAAANKYSKIQASFSKLDPSHKRALFL